ncbi:MAG: hypothetical protein VX519_01140 [Myxococcota bacterium]|nr:hypothetical protein [Myxococcota bacterium]
MAYDPFYQSDEQADVLADVLEIARAAGAGGVTVFDLDGCLFDTRPRQVHIFRELGSQEGYFELYEVETSHFQDWDLKRTLINAGIGEERAEELYPSVRDFWWNRFFTTDYVLYDHAMPGSRQLVADVAAAGGHVVYLTGRDETMREGTEEALRRFGFPIDGDRARLVVKPDFDMDDTEFKAQALVDIAGLGKPVLFFDNEPSNVNHFQDAFPEATVVFVATDHSGKPVTPYEQILRIKGFLT